MFGLSWCIFKRIVFPLFRNLDATWEWRRMFCNYKRRHRHHFSWMRAMVGDSKESYYNYYKTKGLPLS
jgi:hypothetical protein